VTEKNWEKWAISARGAAGFIGPAALIGVPHSCRMPLTDSRANVAGMLETLEAVRNEPPNFV
jgi:hypothetical protein